MQAFVVDLGYCCNKGIGDERCRTKFGDDWRRATCLR